MWQTILPTSVVIGGGVYTKQRVTPKTKRSAIKFGCRMEGKELLAALVVFVLMAIMGMVFAQQYLR